MAVAKKKKAKRKKIKYFKFELKLSKPEKEKILYFCEVKKITPNKMIKNALRDYMKRHGSNLKRQEPVSEKQINIFDVIEQTIDC
jgi:hypothetical protein